VIKQKEMDDSPCSVAQIALAWLLHQQVVTSVIVGAVIIGITFLGEQADALRLFFLALIVVGVVGLKLVTPTAA